MLVDEDPHQLRNRERRMRIVELHGRAFRQRMKIPVLVEMGTHEVLEGRRCEEVFLPQPKLSALRRLVARIKHLRDRIRMRFGGLRLHVLPIIECIEFQRLGGAGAPEAQQVGPAASPTDDEHVVRDRQDALRRPPDVPDGITFADEFHVSPELHRIGRGGAARTPMG